jgi:hypothetical protein
MRSERKSSKFYKAQWTRALKKGVCPVAGCDIKKKTCPHLDDHLNYSSSSPVRRPKLHFTNDIERYDTAADSEYAPPTAGAWQLFRKMRGIGLANDQIQILLRKFLLGMTVRQIKEDMGWTSTETYYRRYREALSVLKTRGYK